MVSKIAGVAVYQEPVKARKRRATLGRADEVIFMGEERNGMYRVTSARAEGWVDRLLMKGLQKSEREVRGRSTKTASGVTPVCRTGVLSAQRAQPSGFCQMRLNGHAKLIAISL